MDAPLVLAAWDIHSKIRKETVMEEPFSPPDWCVHVANTTIETETEQDFVQAVNRIYHDAAHPSHLILPIIERD